MRALIFTLGLLAFSSTSFAHVLTGIDVLVREEFVTLANAHVGLITNHTGIDSSGESTIRLLDTAPNVHLKKIFSPEHGLKGLVDIPKVDDGQHDTGLKIFSLYGETRRPSKASLADIDTLVFDIQDIGTRFYTYISTMGNAMIAASEAGIRFVVLDRPNPINGVNVAGPVLDPGRESFVGFHPIAIRHGMTIGELAFMMKSELNLSLEVEIVKLEGWKRTDYFDNTNLPWVNPSPNMRNLRAAILYPGIGLLETTNVSVGRGTEKPFEIFGAPWINSKKLSTTLNLMNLPGVKFTPAIFTPTSNTFANIQCQGVHITITDRNQLQPVNVGLAIARQLKVDYPNSWQQDRYMRLLGNSAVDAGIRQGLPLHKIAASYQSNLADFVDRRRTYLLYD